MKYIRTKDGRIKAYEEYCDLSYIYQMLDGIAVADTIKELCDEFVVIVDGRHYIRVPAGNPNFPTYGAIWTTGEHGEPILKSVAKMNDEGELELL